jgi:hypothetical protein
LITEGTPGTWNGIELMEAQDLLPNFFRSFLFRKPISA